MAADNKILGQFDLVGIPPAPRGVPQIEVTFDIDANGIVNVSARDKGTGKEQQIRIQASGGLTESEIDKMVRDAETHAEDDKRRRAMVDARVEAERQVHSAEKALQDFGSKVSDADRSAIEAAIAEVRTALEGEDSEAIAKASAALAQVSMKLGEAMYQQQGGAGGDDGPQAPGAEDVVDAEFEEVDEDDRKRSA
jgi:molecular chaperone DnaK